MIKSPGEGKNYHIPFFFFSHLQPIPSPTAFMTLVTYSTVLSSMFLPDRGELLPLSQPGTWTCTLLLSKPSLYLWAILPGLNPQPLVLMRWRCSTLWKNSLVYLLRSKVGFEPSRADTYPLSHSAQTVQAADEVKKIHGWTVINSNQELNQQPLGLAAAHQQGEPFRCTKAFPVSSL